jgi:hypothetical protein
MYQRSQPPSIGAPFKDRPHTAEAPPIAPAAARPVRGERTSSRSASLATFFPDLANVALLGPEHAGPAPFPLLPAAGALDIERAPAARPLCRAPAAQPSVRAPEARRPERPPEAHGASREIVRPRAAAAPPATRVFTEFIRSAGAASEADRSRLPAVLPALGVALRSELRRRSLWESPPAYLGICGWDSWSSANPHRRGGAGRPFGGGAFDELLAECYSYIFVDRLRSLQAQLAVKPNVDGLVFLNIRHFLHERQREFDPLGFRVFEVVRRAVDAGLAAGVLHVVDGDPKLRNDSVLAFDPAADPSRADAAGLDAWISHVDDELLPDLVTARGKRLDEVIARLAKRLPGLRQQGIVVFRFKDLVNPCKDDVRTRWSAILGGEEGLEVAGAPSSGAGAGAAWIDRPDKAYEDLESFRALVACVPAALESYATSKENRLHLSALWQYLHLYSTGEGGEVEALPEAVAAAPAGPRGRRRRHPGRPSDRNLADLLQIPRRELPRLFATLGRMVEDCRCAGARWSAAQGGGHRHRPSQQRLKKDCRCQGAGRGAGERKRKEERAPGTSPN